MLDTQRVGVPSHIRHLGGDTWDGEVSHLDLHPRLHDVLCCPSRELGPAGHRCKERSLQEPVCIFLCMLAVCDLLLSTAAVPKALTVHPVSTQMSFSACLAQMFSIYFILVAESAVLMAMAFGTWPFVTLCDTRLS